MKHHKKQHFVPRCYLATWCDPERLPSQSPYVWLFPENSRKGRRKAPATIFHETDMYTIDGTEARQLVLEHGLAELENRFTRVRDEIIFLRKPIPLEARVILCAFMAAMTARTPAFREHHKEQWGRVLKVADDVKEWATRAPLEEKLRMARMSGASNRRNDTSRSLTYEQVKELAKKPLQTMLPSMIRSLTPAFCNLDMIVLINEDDDLGFITSDNPCVWFDPKAYQRPPMFRTPNLSSPTTEISLPISPQFAILINQHRRSGYMQTPSIAVDELNRRTRFYADKYYVVRKNLTKDIWFEPGVEPEDSWDEIQQRRAEEVDEK